MTAAHLFTATAQEEDDVSKEISSYEDCIKYFTPIQCDAMGYPPATSTPTPAPTATNTPRPTPTPYDECEDLYPPPMWRYDPTPVPTQPPATQPPATQPPATQPPTPTPQPPLNPEPPDVSFRADPTEWHGFTVSASERVRIIANPGNTPLNVEIGIKNWRVDRCPAKQNATALIKSGQKVYLAACGSGTGTVEVRRASDNELIRTYTVDISPVDTPIPPSDLNLPHIPPTHPPAPKPTQTNTPTPTPIPTPSLPIRIIRVTPDRTTVFVKSGLNLPAGETVTDMKLTWRQTSGNLCKWPMACKDHIELTETKDTHVVQNKFKEDSDYTFGLTVKVDRTVKKNGKDVIEEVTYTYKYPSIVQTLRLLDPKVTHVDDNPWPSHTSLSKFHGNVMHVFEVSLGLRPKSDGYTFDIAVPSATGLRAMSTVNDECQWPIPVMAAVTASTRNAGKGKYDAHYFYVGRCALGSGSAKIKITVKVDGEILGAHDIAIPQSRHQKDNIVQYVLGTMPPTVTPGPTPTPAPSVQPYPTPDFPAAIATSAAIWSSISSDTGVDFCKDVNCGGSNSDGKRILVNIETPEPTPVNTSTPAPEPSCGFSATACVIQATDHKSGHIGNQPMYILHPLYFYTTKNPQTGALEYKYHKYNWTDSLAVATAEPNYYYLPATALHEFGHTAGLGHSRRDNDVMFNQHNFQVTPQPSDKDAMKSIYKSHSPH